MFRTWFEFECITILVSEYGIARVIIEDLITGRVRIIYMEV